MPYRLKNGVFLVEGAYNGALLDTNSGLVYSVNPVACKVINYLQENDAYWQRLVHMDVAEEAESSNVSSVPHYESSNQLKFVWFEVVTDDCNERCAHCYTGSMPRTYRAEQGLVDTSLSVIPVEQRPKLRHSNWLRIMKQAYDLGCRRGQLIGGEPFLYKGENGETVLDLAKHLVDIGFTMVEIYTNGTLLTKSKVEIIKRLGIHVAVSLYSGDPLVHDLITRTPGSHAKTLQAIKWLKEAGVPLRVETVLMKINQGTVDETLLLKKELGVNGGRPDPLRPKGRGDNPLLQPDFEQLVKYGLMLKPSFTVSSGQLEHYSSGHSCLLGKITVTEFGDILPCIFSRDNVVGNYLVSHDLESIVLGPALTRVWKTTKDNVLVCKDCEYRYVCFDCRPLSEGAASGNAGYLNAPYPRCTHNPYTGEWGQGLWKVGTDGTPYYDRSHAADIQKIALTVTESNNATSH